MCSSYMAISNNADFPSSDIEPAPEPGVVVVVTGALTGNLICRCVMHRSDTIACLMKKIRAVTGTRQVNQSLHLRRIQPSGVLSKFVQMSELIQPWRDKVRLVLTKVVPPPCAVCHKQEADLDADGSTVRLHFCSGCYSAVYCSETCQRLDWQTHKMSCRCA